MEDLNRMAVFAAVVEQGSMSAAARLLGMTASAVSQHIRQLEAQSGVPLMHRTTRKLSLSEAGQRFYAQCALMLQAARQARAELEAEREEPVGELRIAAVLGLAAPLGRALAPLLHAYPQLRLQLLLDDAHTDLVAERVDMAIRLGSLPDSSWVARPLARLPWWICAAPSLLASHAKPQHPQQLLALPWIARNTGVSITSKLHLQAASGESVQLHTTPRIICNQQQGLQQLCSEGLGLAKLFSLDVAEPVANGQLLRLLPEWDCGSLDIWALTPQRDALPARVRLALKALQAQFAPLAA
ncbi:LysR substrate-binding domain-containing protein [Comamonas sp. J-3]|uniref:LysR substrate-binding domain-containing protein n=1 Tax=Comamonas trifloxystrobinivorans TaxID=3350256 RepID=UPI003726A16D